MAVLETAVNPRSRGFRDSAKEMAALVEGLKSEVAKVRAGGGLRYVTNTSLGDSIGSGYEVNFKDTTSPVAEIEYLYSPRIGFKLRYVNDKFKEERSGAPVKGDHVGLLVNAYF